MIDWILGLPWSWIFLGIFTLVGLYLVWALSTIDFYDDDDDDDDDDDPTGCFGAVSTAALMAMWS